MKQNDETVNRGYSPRSEGFAYSPKNGFRPVTNTDSDSRPPVPDGGSGDDED